MSAVSIDKFFRIFNFLRDNPYITVYKNFQQESNFTEISQNLYNNVLKANSSTSLDLTKSINIVNTALQARQKTRRFIIRTMIPGSYAFNTKDMDLYRNFIVDWASVIRTQKDMMMQASDAYYLDDQDVDKAIKGFGINWCNSKSKPQLPKEKRAKFLYEICNLYKIKGSPISITEALKYMGIANAIIREHWIETVPYYSNKLQIRAVATSKNIQVFNFEKNKYDYFYKGSADDVIIPWDDFSNKLQEIAEPHWWYTHDEIVAINNDPETYLKLQSLTPYFGIVSYNDLSKYKLAISFMERMLSSQFNQFLTGDKEFLPQDIGLDGFNQELTQRKLQIDGFNDPLTLIEVYLTWCYCQIRYDEYLAYTKLKNFITEHQVNIPESELDEFDEKNKPIPLLQYTYPYAYQELIRRLWHYRNKPIQPDTPVTLDIILQQYPGDLSHYYLSENELLAWWDANKEKYADDSDDGSLPAIFTSDKYRFRYNSAKVDTSLDKILCYNGNRSLNYRDEEFEYEEAISDFDRDANQKLNRGTVYNNTKSYFANNYKISTTGLLSHQAYDHVAEYYRNISWYPEAEDNYKENIEHDGSYLMPQYFGKWPETKSWNWAIDEYFYYMSYTPYNWCRWAVERNWNADEEVAYCRPDSEDVLRTSGIGNTFYQNQYVYAYISENTWVRWVVETEWGYCDGPIKPDGSFRIDNDFSKQFITGSVTKQIAAKFLNNKLEEGIDRIGLTVDPFEIRGSKKSLTLSVSEFKKYVSLLDSHLDSNGNLIKNITHFKHNEYIYSYVLDIATKTKRWVRKPCETQWNEDYHGKKIYKGLYHYPNLDLNSRYGAERILRGQYITSIEELKELSLGEVVEYFALNNSNRILVCQSDIGYPAIYEIPQWKGKWVKANSYTTNDIVYDRRGEIYKCLKETPANIPLSNKTYWANIYYGLSVLWQKCPAIELSTTRLGFNQKLMDWVDNVRCSSNEESYGDLADELLSIFSNYMSIQFQDEELNIAGVYKDIANNGLYHDAIEFYKPKRARLLYFSVEFAIDTRSDNSLFLEDIPETTKVIHEIQDHVPHNDLIYLNTKHYHQDNQLVKQETYLTDLSHYQESTPVDVGDYYIYDCPIEYVNGFYKKLTIDGKETDFWVNDHNTVIQKILNPSPVWSGQYASEWIIARRNITGLSRCDALYLNYIGKYTNNSTDPSVGNWYERKHDPSYEQPASFHIVKVSQLPDILRQQDKVQTITPIVDNIMGEISWESVNDKVRENNDYFKETLTHNESQRHTDPAYCTDQIRPMWPGTQSHNKYIALPENITGGKLDIETLDFNQTYKNEEGTEQDSYNTEYRHSYRDQYPYKDRMVVKDGPDTTWNGPEYEDLDNCFENNSKYNGRNLQPGHFFVEQFDQTKLVYISHEIETLFNTSSVIQVYIGNTLIEPAQYEIDTNIGSITFNFNNDPDEGIVYNISDFIKEYIRIVKCEYPEWYINNRTMYYQGASHRPVYIAIQDTEDDMYPCHDWADCCDYYDTGCRHDGPTNPHTEIWEPNQETISQINTVDYTDDWTKYPKNDSYEGQWLPCETAEGNTIDYDLDEWTRYHKKSGYIDINDTETYEYYDREKTHGRQLENPGDTYCNECGHPSESPDQSTRLIPSYLKNCGIYHEKLFHTRKIKSDSYPIFDNVEYWTPWVKINGPDNEERYVPYEIKTPTADESNNFFKYGYVSNDGNYQIRHAFDFSTATHLWQITSTQTTEITENNETKVVYKALYYTKPKPIEHSEEELVGKLTNWVSSPKDFIEGTEFDIAEDILLDENGNETSLVLSNNIFFTLSIQNSGSDLDLIDTEYFWTMRYVKTPGTNYGYVHIFTPDGWKRIKNRAYISDKPKDEYNYFGYWFVKNGNLYDLYLNVEGLDHIGWVVLHNVTTSQGLNNYKDVYNNDWVINGNVLYKLSHMDIRDANYKLNSNTHVCADPIAYIETYDGMYLATKGKKRHTCTVREKVFTNIYDYCSNIRNPFGIEDASDVYYRKLWKTVEENGKIKISDICYIKLDIDHSSYDPDHDPQESGWKYCDSLIYEAIKKNFHKFTATITADEEDALIEDRYSIESSYTDKDYPDVTWVGIKDSNDNLINYTQFEATEFPN